MLLDQVLIKYCQSEDQNRQNPIQACITHLSISLNGLSLNHYIETNVEFHQHINVWFKESHLNVLQRLEQLIFFSAFSGLEPKDPCINQNTTCYIHGVKSAYIPIHLL